MRCLRCWGHRLVVAALSLNLAACSTVQSVRLPPAGGGPPENVFVGSRVEVVTRDREKLEFTVARISAEGLYSQSAFIPYSSMASLRVRTPGSNEQTWSYVLGALGIIALIALIGSADSVKVCSPSPCPEP